MDLKIDDLGAFLKDKRKEKKLTLTCVALRTDLSTGYISRLEKNSSKPSFETVIKLSEVLGFDLEDVIDTSLDSNKTFDIIDLLKNYKLTIYDRDISKFEAEKIIEIIQTIDSVSWDNEVDKYYGVSKIIDNIQLIKEKQVN